MGVLDKFLSIMKLDDGDDEYDEDEFFDDDEYDDDYEVRVFTEAMKLKHELGDVFEPYIISALSPEHWMKHEVNVTPCDLRGLPEG